MSKNTTDEMDVKEREALTYHQYPTPGKLQITATQTIGYAK